MSDNTRASKFDAASEFQRGFLFGMFRVGEMPEDDKQAGSLWFAGYKCAAGLKSGYYDSLNSELDSRGIETIGTVTTCDGEPTNE